MDDVHHRYPALSRRQVALFERNPVCALCYDICHRMRKEYGLVNFKILNCLEEADSLCEQIINNPWELDGVEQYYHHLELRLDYNDLSISCAIAIVCVTFNCMEDLPEPLRQLSYDLEGLLLGHGVELFESLMTAACNQSIILNVSTYGNPPPIPPMIIENQQLRARETALKQQIADYQKQVNAMQPIQYIQINGDVNNGPVYNMSGPVYQAPVSQYFYQQPPTSSTAADNRQEKDPDKTDLRVKRLFTIDGIEDIERTNEESNRFLNFLSDHNIRSRLIDSSQDNPILKAVVCFCAKWKSLRFIESDISPKAVLRFLTVNCELKCDNIDEKAIRNTLARMIRKGYDQVLFGDVCDYF